MEKLSDLYKLGSLEKMSDKHDPRNYQFAALKTAEELPAECLEMKSFLESIGAYRISQKNYGSCTSYGNKRSKDFQEGLLMSAHFLYVCTKKISQIYDAEGDYPMNAQKAICQYGVCEEKYMSSEDLGRNWEDYVRKEPSKEAYANALTHKSRTYWEIERNTLSEVKRALGLFKTPVSISMEWYNSYFNCPKNGRLPLPSGGWEGAHNVAGTGYSDSEGNLWLGNSWGDGWGNKGQFYIPYEEFDAHNITSIFINLDINKDMVYKKNSKTGEQFLVDDNLMIALNIADNNELTYLQGRSLKESPSEITDEELKRYTIYPLIRKDRLGDLFGFNA